MTILITGIAGLLGSRLAKHLKDKGHSVVGIDDLSGGYVENIPQGVPFEVCNILVDEMLEKMFKKHKPDYVFHFAAYAAEGLSPFVRSFNYRNNLVVTSKIVNMCIKYKVKRLVFTSTMAVYGHGLGGRFDERQLPHPIDPYGVAKYACEMDIQIAGEQHGLDWCIIRPHNVYGANQNIWDKYRNVLGIWTYQSLKKELMTIYGDGSQTRAFSYIEDSLEPLWRAAIEPKASKEIINLGGIEEITINDALEIMKEVVGFGEVVYLEKRHEVHWAVPTWQKSVDILGFEHKTSLKEGLEKMWEWAKMQPERERFVWSEYELEEGIYSFWKNKT